MNYSLPEKIKEIRRINNLSQDRFGKKIGVTGKSISAYETGRIKPSLKVLEKMADTYKESIYLVDSSEDSNIIKTISNIQHNMEYLIDIIRKRLSL